MTVSPNGIARLEAIFAGMSPPQRLAIAAEQLQWTVANFATPIADSTVLDLVTRAAAAVQTAVRNSLPIAPTDSALLEAFDEPIQDSEEPGASDLLMSYYLCFDEVGPELTPQRVVVIFDHCYQADYTRYSEPGLAVGDTDPTPREQAILDFQRALVNRYTGSGSSESGNHDPARPR
ncbi:hypothetical protein [Glycomyces harbinensis]|uniref:Uncharacterized protein n=1 Tax=Glycomyces harbinensis TaxID=58114 RepID=A0A1G6Y5H6_9ACTN|nr:hypothetical protein [Glycomyces harbinensis]SDD85669.1 hypothetical protein SAMN05216270_108148 [Glycomyces harbinensis]